MTRGCKWSLLKVRERKYKMEHGGPRWTLEADRMCFSFQELLKPALTYGKGGTR
jgi:hypothetical protein